VLVSAVARDAVVGAAGAHDVLSRVVRGLGGGVCGLVPAADA
jgi:hypothetical protein